MGQKQSVPIENNTHIVWRCLVHELKLCSK
nr:MAG TPA: hypothetical protein [Caudoviricetes sp.]